LIDLSDYNPTRDLSRASTIPRRWYVDPEFLQAEKEKIFLKTWQPVAHLDQVARPGDFVASQIQEEPIVIARSAKGEIHAFSNVCRHRAHPVVTGSGNRTSLQCPYHGWTYGMNGRLLAAPEFEGVNEWNKSEVRLPSLSMEMWGPYIFVNIDSKSVSLREILGKIPSEVDQAGYPVAEMQFVERREYEVQCNWKVYIDNYLEGYHIPMAHQGLFREIDYSQYRVDTFRYYSSAHTPLRNSELHALYYWIFPNFMLNIYPDSLQSNIILPLTADRTLAIFEWFSVRAKDEAVLESIEFSDRIQHEDIAVCEGVQRGLRSKSYEAGRLSVKRENGVHHFHLLLHEFLSL
jgi:phenylpropionate dioxygenase-like ring-hydroxylating dioxygenase large terminal subunit